MCCIRQLREVFAFGSAPRCVIFDRDAKYGAEVPAAIRSTKIKCVRSSLQSPWQNGIAERWVERCRRDLLKHVIAVHQKNPASWERSPLLKPIHSSLASRIALVIINMEGTHLAHPDSLSSHL